MPEEQNPKAASALGQMKPEQVRHLTAAICDRDPTPEEFASLERSIVESEDARRAYLEIRQTHAALVSQATHDQGGVPAKPDLPTATNPKRRVLPSRFLGSFFELAIAAVLLVAILSIPAVWWGGWNLPAVSPVADRPIANNSSPQRLQAVAQITKASDDCRLLISGAYVDSDELIELHPDEEICLITGAIYVRFTSGVQSAILAPAVFTPRTPLSIEMAEGHLTADVGEQGSGFTVETVDAEVVDLGTVFGVSVSSVEGTEVVVFDGEVEINSPRISNSRGYRFASQKVETGEGVEIGNLSAPAPLMSFATANYVLPGELLAHPIKKTGSVIASVTDNLKREDSATYSYEIVSGGMREDAIAFADRGYHQWNGLTEAGIPPYLRGADLVRGFSNLKYAPRYEMQVTLGQPANLYVFWDDRSTVPAWLERDFERTGDKIGLDEGPHVDERHRVLARKFPGLGPGSSIDQTFTIWKRVVEEPSTITCGYNSRSRGHIQMYGVVATPLHQDREI